MKRDTDFKIKMEIKKLVDSLMSYEYYESTYLLFDKELKLEDGRTIRIKLEESDW